MPSPVTIELTVAPASAPGGYKLDHYAVGDGATYREFRPTKFREALEYWAAIGVGQPLQAWACRGSNHWQYCSVIRPAQLGKNSTGVAVWWTAWEHV